MSTLKYFENKFKKLSLDELQKVKDIINDVIKDKRPPLLIFDKNVILECVESNDISWAGETFAANAFTFTSEIMWKIYDKPYLIETISEGWISYSDSETTHISTKWLSNKPPQKHLIEFIENVCKTISLATDDLSEKFIEREYKDVLSDIQFDFKEQKKIPKKNNKIDNNIKDTFRKYGRCTFKLSKNSKIIVEYEDCMDANDANNDINKNIITGMSDITILFKK